jgi:myo-inositol-1(or 4)-monophosphatase
VAAPEAHYDGDRAALDAPLFRAGFRRMLVRQGDDMVGSQTPELEQIRELALRAGDMLRNAEDRFGAVRYKSATELVTDLDRRVEDLVVAAIIASFPDDSICAEEGGQRSGSSDRTWYIDPLDGTTNFVHGYPFYAVSIACVRNGKLWLGAVYAPALDELYLAAGGAGAFLEFPRAGQRRRLPARKPVSLQHSLLATGFPYVRDGTVMRNLAYLRAFLLAPCHGVRRGGSAAIDLCHVAAGKLDGYWEMKLRPWDVAAGTLIAREAIVRVSDFQGEETAWLPGDSVLAAAPDLHERMLAIIQGEGYESL